MFIAENHPLDGKGVVSTIEEQEPKNAAQASVPTKIGENNPTFFFHMITDAGLFVNQDGTATVRRMLLTAKSCGISRVIVYSNDSNIPTTYAGVTVIRGTIINKKQHDRQFLATIRKSPLNYVIMVSAGENSFNRAAISTKGVHLLTGITDLPKRGFDHILAKMAAEHHTGIVIDLSRIINPKSRKQALSRYAEILFLQRKYHFPLTIASGASTIFGIKNTTEILALCSLFGMTRTESYAALTGMDAILYPQPKVRVVDKEVE
ncbi:MAG TPA: hypothetical protein O0Y05_03200 [Methanocorpusculum sp.]|nr:hypothetical protein [Methanocorpusculum sp.]